MSELTTWLLEQIAADEAVARAILEQDYSEGRWEWRMHGLRPSYRTALVNDRGAVVLPPKNDDVFPSTAVAAHSPSRPRPRAGRVCSQAADRGAACLRLQRVVADVQNLRRLG